MNLLKRAWRHFLGDSLYRNSVYLMGSTLVVAVFGFLYWALAAHFYSTKSVGLAATLIAISNVIMILSLLGYDNSFIRHLPKAKNQSAQLDTGFTVSSIAAIIISCAYLLVIRLFVPQLNFVNSTLLWMGFFVFFMIVNMLNFLSNYPFIAHRITHIVLIINTGMGILRLILLVAFTPFGLTGLILSHVLALFAALIVTFYFMKRRMDYSFRLHIDWQELRRTGRYTFNSYVSIVFLTLPAYILPTLVVGRLGASSAAYYYVVAVIIAALNVIPMATSQSLFAEGVWDNQALKAQLTKASKVIFALTVPAVLVLAIGGKIILTIFGKSYAGAGYALLIWLAIAGVPKSLSYILSTVLRIEHEVGKVAAIYIFYALVVLGGSYFGIERGHGLAAIGIATLIAEVLTALLYVLAYARRTKIRKASVTSNL